MYTTIMKSMMKTAIRDKISLFYAAIFPVVLMIGLGVYIKNPDYHKTLLIGSLALGTLFWSVQGVAFQVIQQRNRGVYKLLRTTPIKIPAFIVGMTVARTILGLFVNAFVLVVGLVFFHLTVSLGTALELIVILIMGSLAFSSLGFFVVNLARNEGQINMISNLVYLPMVFGSQAFYSLNHAPHWLAVAGKCFPFQYFVQSLRLAMGFSTLANGPHLLQYGLQLAAITFFELLFIVLSVSTFRYDNEASAKRIKSGLRHV